MKQSAGLTEVGPAGLIFENNTQKMDCDLMNGVVGGLTASLVTVILYVADRRHRRRSQVNADKIQMVKSLSLHLETLRRLLYVVNIYLSNMDSMKAEFLRDTKKRFIETLAAIEKLRKEDPFLLDKKYLIQIDGLLQAIVNVHNFPSEGSSTGNTQKEGRRLQEDAAYQLDVVERQLRSIMGTD